MRAAIHNPYLDTLGGGERYTLAVAESLLNAGYYVDIEWKDSLIKKSLEDRFGRKLDKINFVSDINRGDGYDVCFWVSDGSIPALRSRKNFLHFQVPFRNVNGGGLINKMKLFRINKVICNSKFTKSVIDKEYGVDSIVIYPPVDIENIKPKKKENIILFVGRFSQLKQAKNQHILLSAFKELYNQKYLWRMILAGGVEVGSQEYIERLEEESKGYPITILKSPNFSQIVDIFGKAKIFWSAVGAGVDEDKDPDRVEHFGITVVEAMAANVAPIVFNAGGYKEIVENDANGFLWEKIDDLVNITERLIKDPGRLREIGSKASKDSKKYSYKRFSEEFLRLI